MARESRSLFMALRNSVFPETELHEVTSSSEVGDQSPLVKRLDVELRRSDQKGEAVVTGPWRCLVLTRSQYVWIASNIRKVTVLHQKPPRNKQTYIVLIQVSSTSIGSSVTPNSIKLMLYILIPLFDWGVQILIKSWYFPEGWWQSLWPTLGEKQNPNSFAASECGLFIPLLTTNVLIAGPHPL